MTVSCPGCREKILIEKAQLLKEAAAEVPSPLADSPAEPEAALSGATHATDPRLPPNFSMPSECRLPPGILVGEGPKAARFERELVVYGSHFTHANDLTSIPLMEEVPPLLAVLVDSAAAAPLPMLEPLAQLPPAQRRRTYVVLVADNLKSLDGQQAFRYEVDLTVAAEDLDVAAQLVFLGLSHHEKIYSAFRRAEEALT